MKSRLLLYFTALSCAGSVLSLGGAVAQQKSESQHHHYKLVVLSTLGGPNSFLGGEIIYGTLNNPGIAVVQADKPVPDPFNPGGYIDQVCVEERDPNGLSDAAHTAQLCGEQRVPELD